MSKYIKKTKLNDKTNEISLNLTDETINKLSSILQNEQNPLFIPDVFNLLRINYYAENKIIWLGCEITWENVLDIIAKLNFYDDNTKKPITIYIASPGGECDAGWAIIDMIEKLKKKNIVVNTICMGSCYSMAALILASGTIGHRYAFPSSRIMIHQAGVDLTGGKLSDINITNKELKYWTELGIKYLTKITNKSYKEIEKKFNYDNYMTAQEAKKFGIIDKINVFLS